VIFARGGQKRITRSAAMLGGKVRACSAWSMLPRGDPLAVAASLHRSGTETIMAMTAKEIDARVLEVVAERWRATKPVRIEITDRFPEFASGRLFLVSVYIKEASSDKEHEEHCSVYFVEDDKFTYMETLDDVARSVATTPSFGSVFLSTLLDAFRFSQISGIIALIITITICLMALFISSSNVNPDILKTLSLALTTILGFYFGSARRS
jgi:hypothetical protein